MKYLKKLMCVLVFGSVIVMNAQQNVSCNGAMMTSNLEIAQAQISQETIMLVLHEIDMTKHQTDNCEDCPTTKSLLLDVDFKRGFGFPITEKDSVYLRFTTLQQNLSENKHNQSVVNAIETSRNQSEEIALKNQASTIQEKGKQIAKLMQEAKISPEEAQKQLLALTDSYQNNLGNSSIAKTEPEEFQDKAEFSFTFYNDDSNTKTEAFSGYLYIKEFSEDHFVAEFRGINIEQCVEKRSASSEEENANCTSVESKYLPDTKLLQEGTGTLLINVLIKDFLNNR